MWAGIAYSVLRLAMGWTVRGWKPGGGEILSPVKTGPVAHQPPLKWVPSHSWGKKRPGRGIYNTHPSRALVKERVELYLYPTLGLRGLF